MAKLSLSSESKELIRKIDKLESKIIKIEIAESEKLNSDPALKELEFTLNHAKIDPVEYYSMVNQRKRDLLIENEDYRVLFARREAIISVIGTKEYILFGYMSLGNRFNSIFKKEAHYRKLSEFS